MYVYHYFEEIKQKKTVENSGYNVHCSKLQNGILFQEKVNCSQQHQSAASVLTMRQHKQLVDEKYRNAITCSVISYYYQ